jgi:tRNA(Ile)-lysidine synthase
MLNGSGLAGIAGMAVRRGRIVRPLLGFPRRVLAAQVESRGLEVWHDPANTDRRHQRSWIRMELLPFLRGRYPDIDRTLLRLAGHARRSREAWEGLLEQERVFDLRPECDGVSVAASPFSNYDSSVVRALLGALGRRAGCHVGPMRAAQIEQLLAGGRSGAVAQLGNGCAAELTFGRLRLFRETEGPQPWKPGRINGESGRLRTGPMELAWKTEPAPEGMERNSKTTWFSPGTYLVRPWRPGDRIRPLGGTGRRLVVRCMQDAQIARHLRAAWPVVEAQGTVVWVPGVCRAAEALPEHAQPAVRIDADDR